MSGPQIGPWCCDGEMRMSFADSPTKTPERVWLCRVCRKTLPRKAVGPNRSLPRFVQRGRSA